jgi:hypothetical protein
MCPSATGRKIRPPGIEPATCGLEVARSTYDVAREKALKYSFFGENETTEGLPQQSIF